MDAKKFHPLHRLFDREIVKESPALAKCDSATEASKIRFGVKGMTGFIHVEPETRQAILAFFGDNHSDMMAWANLAEVSYREGEEGGRWVKNEWTPYKHPKPYATARVSFYALPEHKAAYKILAKSFGLPFVVQLVAHRDFGDVVKGFDFLKADKKRYARFERDIVGAFKLFPASMHVNMVHDYAIEKMKQHERSLRPRQPRAPRQRRPNPWATYNAPEADRDLPAFESIASQHGEFTIMVPHTDADLRAIGDAQHHCVGTRGMGYGSSVIDGRICIVALYKKHLADGICVEIDMTDKSITQAQGRGRREPKPKEFEAIQEIVKQLGGPSNAVENYTKNQSR